jgi:hypothetical protein
LSILSLFLPKAAHKIASDLPEPNRFFCLEFYHKNIVKNVKLSYQLDFPKWHFACFQMLDSSIVVLVFLQMSFIADLTDL